MGVIRYQFIGAELNPENDFARFYKRHALEQIRHALDNLFKVTCNRWYDNRGTPRQRRDLVESYREGLRIEWDAVWQDMQELGIDPESEQLTFPAVAGALPNPRRWLEKRGSYRLIKWRPPFLNPLQRVAMCPEFSQPQAPSEFLISSLCRQMYRREVAASPIFSMSCAHWEPWKY